MNTVAKGNQFEDRVFQAIETELLSERLGLLPKACNIFRKKKYYSKSRKANIEIDISIEVFLPDADKWSILWAIECKDYRGSLPVNDVEEFHAKIQQIAGDNVKATLILNGVLQKSAFEYCTSMGIGVARLLPDNQLCAIVRESESHYSPFPRKKIENEAMVALTNAEHSDTNESEKLPYSYGQEKPENEAINALTDLKYTGISESIYAFYDGHFYNDWQSLIETIVS